MTTSHQPFTKPLPQSSLARAAISVVQTLQDDGHQAVFAGGCVRDLLLERPIKDFDIATSADPDTVEQLFSHTHPLGKAFGVIQVLINEHPFEVATFRKDRTYSDGRHPDGVDPGTAEEDAERRDFTINGLFLDPLTHTLTDYVGGQADLEKKVIRAIGDPTARFAEDRLRMLRAVRFASTLDFTLDPETETALTHQADQLGVVAMERIENEFRRILTESAQAGDALRTLQRTGLLSVFLPEAEHLMGCEQPPQFHPEGDVWEHTILMLNLMEEKDPCLAYAVLLHDIGKPTTQTWSDEPDGSRRPRFNGHDKVGAEMADRILRRLKCSNDDRECVVHCVARHMHFMNVDKMKKATLRRFVSAPHFTRELALHRLDCLGCHGWLENWTLCRDFLDTLADEPTLPSPLVSGKDLIEAGLPPGPLLGRWKNALLDQQLQDATLSREDLLAWFMSQREREASPPSDDLPPTC